MQNLPLASFFTVYALPALIALAFAAPLAFLLSFLSNRLQKNHPQKNKDDKTRDDDKKIKEDNTDDDDKKNEQILRLLSGVNCGGCGYPGCAAFAQALQKGQATLDSCRPTKKENKQAIQALLHPGLIDKKTES